MENLFFTAFMLAVLNYPEETARMLEDKICRTNYMITIMPKKFLLVRLAIGNFVARI